MCVRGEYPRRACSLQVRNEYFGLHNLQSLGRGFLISGHGGYKARTDGFPQKLQSATSCDLKLANENIDFNRATGQKCCIIQRYKSEALSIQLERWKRTKSL